MATDHARPTTSSARRATHLHNIGDQTPACSTAGDDVRPTGDDGRLATGNQRFRRDRTHL